jgi:carboxyl-terminal processing protease
MKKISIISLLFLCWMISLTTSCKKESSKPSVKDSTAIKDSISLEINQFIWEGLNTYYLWTDSVPNLSASKFPTMASLNTFLKPYTDHNILFNSLLYTTRDKWSWIVDNYTSLEQEFQGITLSMGYDFGLLIIGSTNQVFGYVKYVVKGSPADKAGLKRGDIFLTVNGTNITTTNYQSLLINSNSYYLGLATISNNTISSNNTNTSVMVAIEVTQDPIYLDTVYNINGTKIGYLVYNEFISDYDLELNNVFKKFKDQGVQQLILDLRYNPGGSGQSAAYLASMLYSTNKNLIFFKNEYNNTVESYLQNLYGSGYFSNYFADSVYAVGTNPGAAISSLNLSKLCIIATGNTASASELVINGLKAYIPVYLVGSTTVGKCVGSMTIYDYDSNGVYDSVAQEKVNPNHKWAMQPIIIKVANALGVSDYYNGFTPDYSISEYDYLSNLLQFGDINEPLLKAAINNVMGYPQTKSFEQQAYSKLADSRDFMPHSYEMYFRPRDLKLNSPAINKSQKEKRNLKR